MLTNILIRTSTSDFGKGGLIPGAYFNQGAYYLWKIPARLAGSKP